MPALVRTRATVSTLATALAAALGWAPFVPRLLIALFTGRGARRRMLELVRAGQDEKAAEPPAVPSRPVRVFLVAGEPSGDLHAADLATAIRAACPESRSV